MNFRWNLRTKSATEIRGKFSRIATTDVDFTHFVTFAQTVGIRFSRKYRKMWRERIGFIAAYEPHLLTWEYSANYSKHDVHHKETSKMRSAAVQIWESRDLCPIQFCTICVWKRVISRAAVVTFRKCEIQEHLAVDALRGTVCQRIGCVFTAEIDSISPSTASFVEQTCVYFFLDMCICAHIQCKRKEEGHVRGQGET